MSLGRSENCASTKFKGTPSGETTCPGLMKVDLWRIDGGEFAEKSDAHLCVANSESRSTDKARQLGAAPTYSNKERTTKHRYKNSGVRVSVHRRLKESIDVVGRQKGGVVYASH